jgi:hypothetical protein
MGSTSRAKKQGGAKRGAKATHCANGHPRTPENVYFAGSQGRWRRCRICRQEAQRRYNESRRQTGDNPKLPAEPFCLWVHKIVDQYGFHRAAIMTGMPDRRIDKFYHRRPEGKGPMVVRLDTVDSALQTFNGHETLADLYPELYEDS